MQWLPAILFLVSSCARLAAAEASKPTWKPCTVHSPNSNRLFDLNPIHKDPPEEGKKQSEGEEGSWHARGHDYGANFTINFCGPVVEELHNVQDLDEGLWRNVSAFYERDEKVYAIGLESYEPIFRGRKLVLNYTGGSLCPSSKSKRDASSPFSLPTKRWNDDEDDDEQSEEEDEKEDTDTEKSPSTPERRKTTVISLMCEKDPLAKTAVSFVAAVDDCVYFFEGRSAHACGGADIENRAMGPAGVFGVIVLIAVGVYFIGGLMYQRNVMHQRGWRQLPNYSMWAAIGGFFRDIFIFLTSSCARFLPSRTGYSRVTLNHDNPRRGHRNEDENRLIDNLDEEWDD